MSLPATATWIGLALLDPAVKDGDHVNENERGRPCAVRVVKPPFVPSHVR